jgi:hypothetical protein
MSLLCQPTLNHQPTLNQKHAASAVTRIGQMAAYQPTSPVGTVFVVVAFGARADVAIDAYEGPQWVDSVEKVDA